MKNKSISADKGIDRRQFIYGCAKGAAVVAAGTSALNFAGRANAQSANNKVVLALIGAGGRGAAHAAGMSKIENVEFKYVCDVNQDRGGDIIRDLEKQQGRAPARIIDMRQAFEDKDVNAVVIATPEHWHALATVWACQEGKDVYVEKNISATIWEGRQMIEAAHKYNRVVQAGLQNRSGPYAFSARDYVQSGKLGNIVHVKVYNLLPGARFMPKPDCPPPATLDWDRWLGPSPEVPYNPGRHIGWYDWWDYKGGAIVDDGVHQLDLTRMVLGDPPAPNSVSCVAGNFAYHSQREVPEMQTVTYDYGDFVMTCESGNATNYMKKFPGEVRYGTKWPNWPISACRVEIYGTKAFMYLGRHGCGWQVIGDDGKIIDQDKGYFPDKWHQPNFIDCVRSRRIPNAPLEQAHLSACLVHMANTAYRVGNRQLLFDRQAERFTNSPPANLLLKPAYRKNYRIPDQV